jgi:aspartyl protease family protein
MDKQLLKLLTLFCLCSIGIYFLFLAIPERFPTLDLKGNSYLYLIAGIVLPAFSLYDFVRSRGVISATKISIIWLSLFIIATALYAFRFELKYASYRILAVIVPSYVQYTEGGLSISRNSDGHFYLEVLINDHANVRFMIDTGASDLALNRPDAELIGFNLEQLNYSKTYSTANGHSKSAPVLLDSIRIGDMVLRSISAGVGQGSSDVSLLGMSIISKFKDFRIDGDILTLSY